MCIEVSVGLVIRERALLWQARGVSRLSSGLSSSDGGQGSTPSASGQNSWQGFGLGSGAGSAQSSLQGLPEGFHVRLTPPIGASDELSS